ncbi:fad-dependent pyridine nucleotide-disulfide [Stemphylium lycopersici]|uniref:FAD-dependent pyridine nucleotide-disulfide oxidoreductase n=1 Tax=Stemphylium lycopersici TaxID=183478 RepID=A0A364MW62_STELY|nr:fad-dependent pyridine nucleotide-disulfide [Stemphylium lycopersici]RAR05354.1 FAD-dependent pyridine nucleotide-disulfide oxidoreductase [Stemphylium lycopersici]
MTTTINPDYLVIGAGAMGLAFVDTLITDTNATVAIVDRYARPGGHWTIAYPHVTLHQPSAFYGVNSQEFPAEKNIDKFGGNKGMSELATGDGVRSYFSRIMQQTFLPSGRVEYYPSHEYVGEGEFRPLITKDKAIRVGPDTRIVDATFMKVEVPAMRPPPYEVAEGVHLTTPNGLVSLTRPYGGYTVVGAGKTGIDACLWLLSRGIDAKDISWIMPRDSWYLNRSNIQPSWSPANNPQSFGAEAEAIMNASDLEDLFYRLEASGNMMRIDKNIWPTMYKCATVSTLELQEIQKVGNIIRQGRIARIAPDEVILEGGNKYTPVPDTLYIDCSADGLARLKPVPVFDGKRITLQSVRFCQQVFSAAFIAHVEATYGDDEKAKNALCTVVPHPDETQDFLSRTLVTYSNALKMYSQPKTRAWSSQARLDMSNSRMPSDPAAAAEAAAAQPAVMQAVCDKLSRLIDVESAKAASKA